VKVTLYAPEGYWKLSEEEKRRICNGCGAKGSKLNFLIPQGVFKEACNIHDYMYFIGRNNNDKRKADRVFINNLYRIVEASPKWIRPIRKARAKSYYLAVSKFGDEAFWKGKVVQGMVGREVEL
jgi:hypothetical protein